MADLLRPADVARELGVSKDTVYRIAQAREIAAHRIRGQWRFEPADVAAYRATTRREALLRIAEPTRPSPTRQIGDGDDLNPLTGKPRTWRLRIPAQGGDDASHAPRSGRTVPVGLSVVYPPLGSADLSDKKKAHDRG